MSSWATMPLLKHLPTSRLIVWFPPARPTYDEHLQIDLASSSFPITPTVRLKDSLQPKEVNYEGMRDKIPKGLTSAANVCPSGLAITVSHSTLHSTGPSRESGRP